ncbi:MAG: response regulator [Chitinivibrionales bacterium]|nr:response regulator [Chitinivibrionales bacterium]
MYHFRNAEMPFTIGIFAPWISSVYEHELLSGITDEARLNNMRVICFGGGILNGHNQAEAQANTCYKLATPANLDALIVPARLLGKNLDDDEMESFIQRFASIPVVSIGRRIRGASQVGFDISRGMFELTSHLHNEHGYRAIALIAGGAHFRTYCEAFGEALDLCGLPRTPGLIVHAGGSYPVAGSKAIDDILDKRKQPLDAIITSMPTLLSGAVSNLAKRGRVLPGDIGGATMTWQVLDEPFTMMCEPTTESGREAVRLALRQLDRRGELEEVRLSCKMLVRQSCGCIARVAPHLPELQICLQQSDRNSSSVRDELVEQLAHLMLSFGPNQAPLCSLLEAIADQFLTRDTNELTQECSEFIKLYLKRFMDLRNAPFALANCISRAYIFCREKCPDYMPRGADRIWLRMQSLILEETYRCELRQDYLIPRTFWEPLSFLNTQFAVLSNRQDMVRNLPWLLNSCDTGFCAIAVYLDGEAPTQHSQLIYAFDGLQRENPVTFAPEEFETCRLFPLSDTTPAALLVLPLFTQDQIGYIIFDLSPAKLEIYKQVQQLVATVLTTSTLIEKVKRQVDTLDAANLSLKQEICRRKQLQEELVQSQKMEAIGRLSGGIAHDFNNMLTILMGNSILLGKYLEQAEAPDEVKRKLGAIKDVAQKAAGLTRQLLAFSKKQVFSVKVLDLNEVVAGMAQLIEHSIGPKNKLMVDINDQPIMIKGDKTQIEQVLLNLAVNARDAMNAGGILHVNTCVGLGQDIEHLKRTRMRKSTVARLTVRDSGCGMDVETMEKIFEPFFTTKPGGKGTGMGLATVYGIVQQSGGHIQVYSEPGTGTTFDIYLPSANQSQPAKDPSVDETQSIRMAVKSSAKTVLVADDEPSIRILVAQLLRDEGFTVLEAGDGDEAVRLANEHKGTIDLLISDVIMPHIDGPEVAAQVLGKYPGMKVFYMSGYSRDLRQIGENEVFIRKPFRVDDFYDTLQTICC